MSAELSQVFSNKLGTGSGPTRLEQLRNLAIIGELPMAEPVGKQTKPTINIETITKLKMMTDNEWSTLFDRYRNMTKGKAVRLSSHGLNQIREIVASYELPTP